MAVEATRSGSLPWKVWARGGRAPSTPLDTLAGPDCGEFIGFSSRQQAPWRAGTPLWFIYRGVPELLQDPGPARRLRIARILAHRPSRIAHAPIRPGSGSCRIL